MRFISLLVLALAAVMLAPAKADAAIFGTRCQSDFQNGWSVTLPEVWDRCAWFNDELDDTDQKAFYFNFMVPTSNLPPAMSVPPDQIPLHLLYVDSHGGANPGNAGIFMWDQRSIAITPRDGMRYGDENVGLAILAQYLCRLSASIVMPISSPVGFPSFAAHDHGNGQSRSRMGRGHDR